MITTDTSVKYFHSEMPDAPALPGESGSFVALFDTLRSGFCTRAADSVTVTDGIATVVLAAGNPYEFPAVIKLAGAAEPLINGEHRIQTSLADRFTFACPDVPDGPIGGTIVVVRAGLSMWAKPYSDGDRAVYQSADPLSTQLYLYVDDADPMYTRPRGYESIIDIDTRSGPFPTYAQLAAGGIWRKSSTANGVARRWVVIADDSFFWFMPAWHASYPGMRIANNFGDLVQIVDHDAYHCILTAHSAAPAQPGTAHVGTNSATVNSRHVARGAAQTGGPIDLNNHTSGSWGWYAGVSPLAPGADDNVLVGGEIVLSQGTNAAGLRGILPGPRQLFQHSVFSDLEVVRIGDEVLLCVATCYGAGAATFTAHGVFSLQSWRGA